MSYPRFPTSRCKVELAVATIAASIEHYANAVFASYQLKSAVEGASPSTGWANIHYGNNMKLSSA